jgi:hypothetical protein
VGLKHLSYRGHMCKTTLLLVRDAGAQNCG